VYRRYPDGARSGLRRPSASRNLILEIEISGNSVRSMAITWPMLRVGCRLRDSGTGALADSAARARASPAVLAGDSADFGMARGYSGARLLPK
jgi:hypothetical protein